MEGKVKAFIENNKLNIDNTIICAVSGGVDSVVLINILKKLGYNVVLAHVNHNVRLESKIEQEAMKNFAIELDCPFELLNYHFDGDGNFEAKAREARYNFFELLCKKYNTDLIATAHHLDDQLETVIMKIMDGSNLYGYGGIAVKYDNSKYRVIRPLLCVCKDELYEYAKLNNIKYFEDSSNESNLYLRNRLRHNVIPLLKKECGDIYDKIEKYSLMVHEAFDFIRGISIKYLSDNNDVIDIKSFNEFDIAVRKDIISLILERNNINRNNNIINDIVVFLDDDNGNKYLALSNGFLLFREYDKAYIGKNDNVIPKPIVIDIENEGIFDDKYRIYFSKNIPLNNAKYIKLCYNELKLPLEIRAKKPGDFISIDNGIKKVSRVFIDRKIPTRIRNNIPIICDSSGKLLWIYDYLKSNEVYKMKQKGSIYLVVEEIDYEL
ncbi:MAG: tRNA lysidine(34) synthetase TilS [Acholeplasmatales bacterium]|nr:tRNA lysidine(34) synthetase TilS [Acholeplasmatales bacterium]